MKRKMLFALALLVILLAVIASVYANRDYLVFVLAPEGSYMGGAVLDASDAQLELDWEAFQNAPDGSYMGAAVTATPAAGTLGNSNLSPAGAAANAEWQESLHSGETRP